MLPDLLHLPRAAFIPAFALLLTAALFALHRFTFHR
jgi:hypothetical protein